MCVIEVLQWIATAIAEPLPDGARRSILDRVHQDIQRSWKGRTDFVKEWLNVNWARDSWHQEWQGFVEARNAWAHGSGRLTQSQLARGGTNNLSAAKLQVANHEVRPEPTDVRRCAESARRLLDELEFLQSRLPE